ncbi:hypothetical protein [Spirosoma areae]
MKKNVLFFDILTGFLKENPALTWQSVSSGEAIQAVRLPWYKILRWTDEPNGEAEKRLDYAVESDVPDGKFYQLHNLFVEKKLVSFKRKTADRNTFDLYILAFYGWWYVGIKTRLVEE